MLKNKIIWVLIILIVISSIIGCTLFNPEDDNKETKKLDLKRGLVAYYPLNNNANDESGNGNNGTANNEINFGIEGVSFDGTNDVIEIDDFSMGLEEISFSFLAKYSGSKSENIPFADKDGEVSIGVISSTNEFYVYIATDEGENPTIKLLNVLEKDKWTHIVVTYDGEYIKIFVNAKLIKQNKLFGLINNSDNSLYLGSDETAIYHHFNGSLRNFLIYNRALTEMEIIQLYNNGGKP